VRLIGDPFGVSVGQKSAVADAGSNIASATMEDSEMRCVINKLKNRFNRCSFVRDRETYLKLTSLSSRILSSCAQRRYTTKVR